MSNQSTDPKKDNNQDAPLNPEPETLHTTDPQEHMEGPVSSIMQNIKETGEENDQQPKEKDESK